MVEEGGTETIQNNKIEPTATQDKSNRMADNKTNEEVKMTDEEEDPIQTQHNSPAACERE
jgi:hypothetical protein